MKILEWLKDRGSLINENMKIRKGKFDIEQKFNAMLEDLDVITVKYTKLLEEKSDRFDLYVKYQNQCVELANEKRELKKQNALLSETLNEQNDRVAFLEKEKGRLERKVSKAKKVEVCK